MHIRHLGCVRRLLRATRGVALLEFALGLPVFLLMALAGAELCNYITVKMRVSQIALQVADNASRMGEGSLLSAKTVSEADISDVFIGANMQSAALNLLQNGHIILSDLEVDPNNSAKYKIMWQRCYGNASHASQYGNVGDANLSGIGPANYQVTTQADNATMFVEVYLPYKPLISGTLVPTTTFDEVASMSVRDRRDLTTIAHTGCPAPPS